MHFSLRVTEIVKCPKKAYVRLVLKKQLTCKESTVFPHTSSCQLFSHLAFTPMNEASKFPIFSTIILHHLTPLIYALTLLVTMYMLDVRFEGKFLLLPYRMVLYFMGEYWTKIEMKEVNWFEVYARSAHHPHPAMLLFPYSTLCGQGKLLSACTKCQHFTYADESD